MKLSEAINKLGAIYKEHGDLNLNCVKITETGATYTQGPVDFIEAYDKYGNKPDTSLDRRAVEAFIH